MYCQIEILRRCFPASLRQTLNELPETLDGTYEQTLRGIDKQKRDYAYRLFQFLVVSKRPLRIEELAELFAIQPNGTIPTFDACLRPDDPEEFVLSACSTLVIVIDVGGQKIVQFSHFSVREYLISDRIAFSEHFSRFHVLPRPAHALLAKACLGVLLQLDDRADGDHSPLASYAARYWVDHAEFENISSEIRHGIECLFDKNKRHLKSWLHIYNMDSLYFGKVANSNAVWPDGVPLYYAALCGFRDIARHFLEARPQDVNARGGEHLTPLHAAVHYGHLSVVMLLLEHGANMETRDVHGSSPLHSASYRGYTEVVSLLIDRSANLNAKDFDQKTPLYLALERGHDEIVRLLLNHGADANHPDNHGRTPVHLASESGRGEIVRLLLDHGADTNRTDNRGWSPLHHASLGGHTDAVQLLLGHGAVANSSDHRGWTPLHYTSQEGHKDSVELLLRHGAVANQPENCGWTPLHLAPLWGRDGTAQLLLHHCAVMNYPDNYGLRTGDNGMEYPGESL